MIYSTLLIHLVNYVSLHEQLIFVKNKTKQKKKQKPEAYFIHLRFKLNWNPVPVVSWRAFPHLDEYKKEKKLWKTWLNK